MKSVKSTGKTVYIVGNPELVKLIDAVIKEFEGTQVQTLGDGGDHPSTPKGGG